MCFGFDSKAFSAGMTYAMTGEVTLNVLNLSDLTGGALSSGVLEMRLGKDGVT
jgi:hypothetical protein